MPSGPDAFDVSRLFKISSVSACDMFMEANLEFVLYTISGRLALEVSIVANCKKALLNSSAFTMSSVKIRSPHFIAGIWLLLVLPMNCLAICHHDLGLVDVTPSLSLDARFALYVP